MFIPINLKYTKNHLWTRPIGREDIYIGLTDFAERELGRIDLIEINHEGKILMKGKTFGIIYGANKTLDLIMPVNGQVLVNNDAVLKRPQVLNSDPYHNWIALVTIKNYSIDEKDFLTANDYRALVDTIFAGKLN